MIETEKRYTDGPYDKFLSHGPESLSKAELLAIILRTGTKKNSAVELAKQILSLSNDERGLNGLHHITIDELKSIEGIGEVKAVKILCLAELSKRMARECAARKLAFNSPRTVVDYYKESLRHCERETVLLLLLDTRLQLISDEYVLSLGTVKASLLSPREIFVKAAREKAVYIMLIHNHPSGSCEPSEKDRNITEQIAAAGQMMDIPLIDHIIIGNNNYYSFKEQGLL